MLLKVVMVPNIHHKNCNQAQPSIRLVIQKPDAEACSRSTIVHWALVYKPNKGAKKTQGTNNNATIADSVQNPKVGRSSQGYDAVNFKLNQRILWNARAQRKNVVNSKAVNDLSHNFEVYKCLLMIQMRVW